MSLPGNIADIAIALQANKGVPAGVAQHRMRISGGGFMELKEAEDIVESTGQRMLEAAFVARVRLEGEPQFVVRPNFIGLLLYAAMGAKAAVAGTVNISSSSVASPTVITTTTAHGLTSGQSVTIAGHTGSTPDINGTHTVTVLSATTFSIPVNVTVGGTGGTVTTGQHTHTLTLAEQLPWLTVWAQLANGKRVRGTDCKVVKLHLESSASGLLIATATIIGRTPHFRDAATYATEAEAVAVEVDDYFLHAHGEGAFLVEGSAQPLERAVLDIDNSGSAQYGDSVSPTDVSAARQVVTVETTHIIDDFALFNRVHYGTASPAAGDPVTTQVLELGGTPVGVQWTYTEDAAAGSLRRLRLAVPRVMVLSMGGLEYNGAGDPIKQAVTYRAYRPGSGSGLTATLSNAHPAYPALP